MEITDKDYFVGVWYAANRKGDNFLCTVKRDPELGGNNWLLEYRFRFKVDDKIFDSEDKKYFRLYKAKNMTEEQIINDLNKIFVDSIIKAYDHEHEFVEIKGGHEKFLFHMAQREWCNVRQENLNDGKQKESKS